MSAIQTAAAAMAEISLGLPTGSLDPRLFPDNPPPPPSTPAAVVGQPAVAPVPATAPAPTHTPHVPGPAAVAAHPAVAPAPLAAGRPVITKSQQGLYINGIFPVGGRFALFVVPQHDCDRCSRMGKACRLLFRDTARVFAQRPPYAMDYAPATVCGNCYGTGRNANCSFWEACK